MLKLLHFIPCRTIIVDTGGSASIISVMERIDVNVPSNVPENFLYPEKWSAVALWTRDPKIKIENPIEYEQLIQFVMPNDSVSMQMRTSFLVSNKHINVRIVNEFVGLPVSKSGLAVIQLLLRVKSEENWTTSFNYPVFINRQTVKLESTVEVSNAIERQHPIEN